MPSDNLGTLDMPLRKLDGVTITINVEETREWRLRLWLGMKLIALGYRVLGCEAETKTEDVEE